jgi:hypothetical protein
MSLFSNLRNAGGLLCALTVLLLAGLASAQSVNVTVVATGLDRPRGLKFGPDGALYVAEAGRGGPTLSIDFPCQQVPPPIGPYHGGPTARISKITLDGHVSTVADGLPSGTNNTPTEDTLGVADLAFVGHSLFALLSGGGCSHANPDVPNGVIKVDADHGTWSYVVNLSAWVRTHPAANPGPSIGDFEPDGTWYGMIALRGNLYATEPNQQHIVRISPTTGKVDQLADISASSSLWVGPTGLTSHGDIFFGNLAPFPIEPGIANVFKLTPSGNFKLWREGLTTVVGVAFDQRDRLYVLELSDAPGFPTPGAGKLLRISPSGRVEEILTGLVTPTAMTIGPDGAIYISDFGDGLPGQGQIVRVDVTE